MRKKKNGLSTDIEGNRYWFKNYLLHREDGPAIEFADGKKFWYQEGKKHRDDGPAVEFWHGNNQWYLNGCELSEEEFNAIKEKEKLEQNLSLSTLNKKIKI